MTALLDFILGHAHFRSARLPSLYSDFRHLRTNNPNGFFANVTAWKAVLSAASHQGVFAGTPDTLILHTGEELVSSLATREWGRPLALGTVVSEAVQTREFIPLDIFLVQAESVYHRAWINPWGVLSWGLETAGLKTRVAADEKLKKGAFVVLKNVEDSANKILQQIAQRPNNVGRIFTLDLFAEEFTNPLNPSTKFSEADLNVLVKFISRDLREASVSGTTIKFKNANEDPSPITESDTTIANLKSIVSSLHSQIDLLAAKISQCNTKAHAALANKNKIVALAALRSRKIAENTLHTRAKALSQIEEVLGKIEQAADNVELVTQLQRSTKVLKMLNRQTGGVEKVAEQVDALKEQMEEVEEVTRIIGEEGVQPDESELEEELEEILREEEKNQEMADFEVRRKAAAKIRLSAPEARVSKLLENLSLEDGEKEQEQQQKKAPFLTS